MSPKLQLLFAFMIGTAFFPFFGFIGELVKPEPTPEEIAQQAKFAQEGEQLMSIIRYDLSSGRYVCVDETQDQLKNKF